MGIEPTALAWEARVLPLYDARAGIPENATTAPGHSSSHAPRRPGDLAPAASCDAGHIRCVTYLRKYFHGRYET